MLKPNFSSIQITVILLFCLLTSLPLSSGAATVYLKRSPIGALSRQTSAVNGVAEYGGSAPGESRDGGGPGATGSRVENRRRPPQIVFLAPGAGSIGGSLDEPSSEPLYDRVFVCKERFPVWNVGIMNTRGELLLVAYAGSEEKANNLAACVRLDMTSMKREEYLKFAMYNCAGVEACVPNLEEGSCACNLGLAPERCIHVEYTRALIACRYRTRGGSLDGGESIYDGDALFKDPEFVE